MGLLDDLQSEVKKRKADDLKQNAELQAQEDFYYAQLKPAMLQVYDYFSEVVESLQVVAPDIRPSYPLEPLQNQGVRFRQSDYEFDFDSAKNPRQINIYCTCKLERPLEFHVPSKESVLKYTELLEGYGLPFHCKNHLDKLYNIRGGTFLLEGPMNVHMRILAHPADRCIYINLRNLEDQPLKRYKFSPEAIDNEFLERLARLLLQEESKLVEVQVCDNIRDKLRHQVAEDKRRNEEDLAQAYQHIEAERLAEEDARLINRTKKAMSDGVDRVSKAIKNLK